MTRRAILTAFAAALPCPGQKASATFVRGRLSVKDGTPILTTADGKAIALSGDEPTMLVFRDTRLAGSDMQVHGKRTGDASFAADPIHTWALLVHKNGKGLRVTYWCDVCYIRTYSPGKCWCCQDETALELLDPDKVEKK